MAAVPRGADVPGAAPARAAEDLVIYPRNGQNSDKIAADRYECHNWARGESGFDPTAVAAGGSTAAEGSRPERYRRAMAACLEGRGYSVG
jgi:hypothetical protein